MKRATPHIQTNLRLSVETYEMIESLMPTYGTKAAVVTEAVRQLAQQGKRTRKKPEQIRPQEEHDTKGMGNRGGGVKAFGIDERERDILDRMKALKVEGHSLQEIADILNAEGFRNRKGNMWTKGNVDSILRKQR